METWRHLVSLSFPESEDHNMQEPLYKMNPSPGGAPPPAFVLIPPAVQLLPLPTRTLPRLSTTTSKHENFELHDIVDAVGEERIPPLFNYPPDPEASSEDNLPRRLLDQFSFSSLTHRLPMPLESLEYAPLRAHGVVLPPPTAAITYTPLPVFIDVEEWCIEYAATARIWVKSKQQCWYLLCKPASAYEPYYVTTRKRLELAQALHTLLANLEEADLRTLTFEQVVTSLKKTLGPTITSEELTRDYQFILNQFSATLGSNCPFFHSLINCRRVNMDCAACRRAISAGNPQPCSHHTNKRKRTNSKADIFEWHESPPTTPIAVPASITTADRIVVDASLEPRGLLETTEEFHEVLRHPPPKKQKHDTAAVMLPTVRVPLAAETPTVVIDLTDSDDTTTAEFYARNATRSIDRSGGISKSGNAATHNQASPVRPYVYIAPTVAHYRQPPSYISTSPQSAKTNGADWKTRAYTPTSGLQLLVPTLPSLADIERQRTDQREALGTSQEEQRKLARQRKQEEKKRQREEAKKYPMEDLLLPDVLPPEETTRLLVAWKEPSESPDHIDAGELLQVWCFLHNFRDALEIAAELPATPRQLEDILLSPATPQNYELLWQIHQPLLELVRDETEQILASEPTSDTQKSTTPAAHKGEKRPRGRPPGSRSKTAAQSTSPSPDVPPSVHDDEVVLMDEDFEEEQRPPPKKPPSIAMPVPPIASKIVAEEYPQWHWLLTHQLSRVPLTRSTWPEVFRQVVIAYTALTHASVYQSLSPRPLLPSMGALTLCEQLDTKEYHQCPAGTRLSALAWLINEALTSNALRERVDATLKRIQDCLTEVRQIRKKARERRNRAAEKAATEAPSGEDAEDKEETEAEDEAEDPQQSAEAAAAIAALEEEDGEGDADQRDALAGTASSEAATTITTTSTTTAAASEKESEEKQEDGSTAATKKKYRKYAIQLRYTKVEEKALRRIARTLSESYTNLRASAIGEDRHFRRYYRFPIGAAKGVLYVEEPCPLQLRAPSDEADAVDGGHHWRSPRASRWYTCESRESLDTLIAQLNPKGVREQALKTALERAYISTIRVMGKTTPVASPPAITSSGSDPSDTTTAPQEGALQMQLRSRSSRSEASSSSTASTLQPPEEAPSASSVKAQLQELQSKMKTHLLWQYATAVEEGVSWKDKKRSWTSILNNANDIPELAAAAAMLASDVLHKRAFISTWFVKSAPPQAPSSADESAPQRRTRAEHWIAVTRQARTASQLLVLLAIFDNHISWNKFESLRCRRCKGSRSNTTLLVLCERCSEAYHPACVGPPLASMPVGRWVCPDCDPAAGNTNSSQNESDEMMENEVVTREKTDDHAKKPTSDRDRCCCVCSDSKGSLVACDVCSKGYHLQCIDPPLQSPPPRRWMCPLHAAPSATVTTRSAAKAAAAAVAKPSKRSSSRRR